jgi:predicted Kef-type K+ transport protein
VVEQFIDTFTFFPRELFGLAALVLALGLAFSAAQMLIRFYK